MNTLKLKSVAKVFASLVVALAGNTVLAATTWNLAANCVSGANSAGSLGTTESCTGTALGVSLSGYSTTGSGSTFAAANIYTFGTDGLGIVSGSESATTEGAHAMDSVGNVEAMMIKFTDVVKMESLQIGWNGTDPNAAANNYKDSDLSVYAWTEVGTTPTGSPLNNLSGGGAAIGMSGLVSAGWALVGNYANVGSFANNTQSITTNLTSSYWLVTAGGTDTTGDSFKIVGTTTSSNKTPEPGSLALLGLGLVGIVAARRRTKLNV